MCQVKLKKVKHVASFRLRKVRGFQFCRNVNKVKIEVLLFNL